MPEAPYSLADLDAALTPAKLRVISVLGIAMGGAPFIYVVLGLFVSRAVPVPAQAPSMALVAALVWLGCLQFALAGRIADWSLRHLDLANALDHGLRQGKGGVIQGRIPILQALLTKHVVLRLALVESVGVYGLLLSFLAGGLVRQDWRWASVLLMPVLAGAWALATFPGRSHLQAVFNRTLEGRP
jgi:hypothetical protein